MPLPCGDKLGHRDKGSTMTPRGLPPNLKDRAQPWSRFPLSTNFIPEGRMEDAHPTFQFSGNSQQWVALPQSIHAFHFSFSPHNFTFYNRPVAEILAGSAEAFGVIVTLFAAVIPPTSRRPQAVPIVTIKPFVQSTRRPYSQALLLRSSWCEGSLLRWRDA